MAALLDVNALISLVDPDHVDHQTMQTWFLVHHQEGWATCPLTENGMVRVLSQPAYPSGQRSPAEVIELLGALKSAFIGSYEFWPDDLSLTESEAVHSHLIGGPRQVTDVYLLALAQKRAATVVSFDRSLAWQCVRGASKRLIQLPS